MSKKRSNEFKDAPAHLIKRLRANITKEDHKLMRAFLKAHSIKLVFES